MSILPIRVFLVEDHDLVRAGIRQLLECTTGIQVVGEAAAAEDACEALEACAPDVVIMDVTLPGMSGIETIGRMLRRLPSLHILMLSMHESEPFPELALKRGARGYLSKRCAPEELVTAVQQVAKGQRYLSQDIAQQVALNQVTGETTGVRGLSPREFEVFILLARGESAREVAEILHLSHKTVHVHRANLMRKLGVTSNTELVKVALRGGYLEFPSNSESTQEKS